jgi:hypothetical protein
LGKCWAKIEQVDGRDRFAVFVEGRDGEIYHCDLDANDPKLLDNLNIALPELLGLAAGVYLADLRHAALSVLMESSDA